LWVTTLLNGIWCNIAGYTIKRRLDRNLKVNFLLIMKCKMWVHIPFYETKRTVSMIDYIKELAVVVVIMRLNNFLKVLKYCLN